MIARKNIARLILTLVLFTVFYLGYRVVTKVRAKSRIENQINQLHAYNLFNLDSTFQEQSFLENRKKTMIILFNSECDHCGNELAEIDKNIDQLLSVNILMISTEPINTIKKFTKDYRIASQQNAHICKINSEDMFTSFGPISFPYILIYDSDKSLLKEFKGETSITEILKYLRS